MSLPISMPRKLLTAVVAPIAVIACATAVAVPSSIASSTPSRSSAPVAAAPRAASAGHYTSRVVGSFGRAGTVRGQFVPLRSFVRAGKTVVQGNMTATMRRGNGALVGRVTRHDMIVPINAPGARRTAAAPMAVQATCSVLHLVLGPLNLNLLGLKVHLNRVVLNITAQSGPGNLLGNLLCAVTHLLDNVNPSLLNLLNLASLLNRVIGQIT
jgi:hypothetical protein